MQNIDVNMPQYIEKPTIITLRVEVPQGLESAFVDWQARLNSETIACPGFVSLEFLSLEERHKGCLLVQRFSDAATADAWRASSHYQTLLCDLEKLVGKEKIQEVSASEESLGGGITEVIVTAVAPNKEEAFRRWSAKIHHAEAKFPGFRGVYLQSPTQSKGRHWITLLQFDSREHLDRWLDSPERQKLLEEAAPLVSSIETHRMISPYAGWFASIAKVGEVPSAWKQTMLVLLALFPIVMLELRFLSPLTAHLDRSLGVFIANALSVTLISFPLLPLLIKALGWWLSPKGGHRSLLTKMGTLLILLLYATEIALFWKFI